jgi:hypothetical protein
MSGKNKSQKKSEEPLSSNAAKIVDHCNRDVFFVSLRGENVNAIRKATDYCQPFGQRSAEAVNGRTDWRI